MTQAVHDFMRSGGARSGQVWGALGAVALHAAVAVIALECQPTQASAPLTVTEVDLMPVELPVPEPAKAPEPPPEPEKEPEPAPRPAPRAARPAAAAPPPAAAGALHTAREDAPDPSSEPVRFAVDPNGGAYGFGVVAAGGSRNGQAGGNGSIPNAPTAPAPAAPAPAAARAFAVPPRLEESDPCRGFFPTAASADRGEVTVALRIGADGTVQRVSVQREAPLHQGFGASAMRCLKAKRFIPARDENDRAAIAEAPVTVRFSR